LDHFVPGTGEYLLVDPALCSKEQEAHIGNTLVQRVRNRQSRVQMTSRPATGEYHQRSITALHGVD
jgi:hypothetical protein